MHWPVFSLWTIMAGCAHWGILAILKLAFLIVFLWRCMCMDLHISFTQFVYMGGLKSIMRSNGIWRISMSVRTFYPRRGQRELLDVRTENSSSNEGQEKGFGGWEEFSRCPACSQEIDVLLILPCSHLMCHQCVAVGDGLKSSASCRRSAGLPVCAVWCPSCRHPVELPCWNWSSAASCLPTYHILSPVQLNTETAHKDHLQQVRDSN